MRPAIIIALISATLVCTWSCTQPTTSVPEAGAKAPVGEAPAPDSLACADLNGMTFNVMYYLDNKQHSTDVWYFVGDSIRSEVFEKEGFGYLKGMCRPRTSASVQGKVRARHDQVFLSVSYVVVDGTIDGMLSKGGKGDAGTLTLTFAGKLR